MPDDETPIPPTPGLAEFLTPAQKVSAPSVIDAAREDLAKEVEEQLEAYKAEEHGFSLRETTVLHQGRHPTFAICFKGLPIPVDHDPRKTILFTGELLYSIRGLIAKNGFKYPRKEG